MNDYKKMLKAALSISDSKIENIELAVKSSLQSNDMDFAWKAALYVKNIN